MKVLKASAGSGKTYALSHSYIQLLLDSDDRYAYRHILAVTFTNKATAEMKSRILRDLSAMARDNPKAGRLLSDILHDYSAFSICTIDRFFQQTLKAFSREIGQFSSYRIELDRKSLIQETMDRILDSLDENSAELTAWIKESVADKLGTGKKFNIDEGLYDTGALLKNEEHRRLCEKYGINDAESFSKERLAAIRKSCRRIIKDFEENAAALGLAFEPGEGIKKPGIRTLSKDPGLEILFGEPYRLYRTALILDGQIYSLGLAGEFYRTFESLVKEKNVMPLEDSNTILRDIIDGSDAPFVYEKTGVRYEHFLLDEFQDTSSIQWSNFLPLLKESEAASEPGKLSNLIVGDVKQSIYRWRDSDWRLLGEEVQKEFPGVIPEVLDCNWRSTQTVVDFNNRFFTKAAKAIGTSIYDDVFQKCMTKDKQPGHVRVSFVDDPSEAVVASIYEARVSGALWSDIAVLVRSRKEGSIIAARLIKEGLPVISNEALRVKSSLTVRRLVSLLHYMDNPSNTIGGYLARQLGFELVRNHHSLLDLCEELLRSLSYKDETVFSGETLFIQAFMDELRNWVDTNGNNIRDFLQYWEDADPYIASPENSASIRILTIHKSKGLEFPFVIFPYAEKVSLYKADTHWCLLNGGGTGMGDEVNGIYPVSLGSVSPDTLFSNAYLKERNLQAIDNINVFYVALTRASKAMHIISSIPSKKFREALDKGRPEYVNFSEMLYEFCCKATDCSFGVPYDFSAMERKVAEHIEAFPASYPSIPAEGRISASKDALDYFGEDGVTGTSASARLCGIELHRILESVRDSSDLPGNLDSQSRALLEERIAAHPEWFDAGTVRNEISIIDSSGKEHRPDRVIIRGRSAFILDYKFGSIHRKSYIAQVQDYIKLYKEMGWMDVKGAVWYVPEDKVIEVT